MRKFFLSLFCFIILVGCTAKKSDDGSISRQISDRKLKIVTTTGMIADAVKNIGGDRVTVQALMGPGVDPHLFKASEGDVTRMASADLIFYNGLHLEGKMTEIFEKMSGRVTAVAIGETVDPADLLAPPEFEGNYDPHIWFDVSLWLRATRIISETLIALDTLHQDSYLSNMEATEIRLNELHNEVLSKANEIPPDNRVLITAHDAFNYFGRAYGFEVRGLQGISTSSEAGTADVQNLAEFIVKRKIPAIFVESSVSPRSIEALQAAVRSRNFAVKIGGNLYSDAMGTEGTPAGTYIGMVRHNINTIVHALK
jgi:manganese/zinc/iron transport system substrate-binding protein